MTYSTEELLNVTRSSFREIGYSDELLLTNYRFADFLSSSYPVRQVPLAGFAQQPPSYRTAGFCVVIGTEGGNNPNLVDYTALGAPHLLVLDPQRGSIHRWRLLSVREPRFIETLPPGALRATVKANEEDWGPAGILRAKSIGLYGRPEQLDFYDLGLLPALEREVHIKLDQLFSGTMSTAVTAHEVRYGRAMSTKEYRSLFRLVFRLIAAKLLADRGYPGDWSPPNADAAIVAVNDFYFRTSSPDEIVLHHEIQQLVWDEIRSGFHLENLSLEALAHVYENTFVSTETRRDYDTHATPPEVAEYVVQQLPFESLPPEERTVFEPFSGHAPFLTAALGRLRSLLPSGVDTAARHQYLIRMLSGIELDSFAREVARYSLILADYPNPNGWQIVEANAFTALEFDQFLTRSNIVLCNPPFGQFTQEERTSYVGIKSPNRAVEAMLRVLAQPPRMLGFVLPRSFTDGRIYRLVRQRLAETYGNISITALPDIAFRFSEAETVVVLASDRFGKTRRWHRAFVSKDDYARFWRTGRPTWEDSEIASSVDREPQLWKNPLAKNLRAHLRHYPTIAQVAEVHRGIEYLSQVDEHVAHEPLSDYAPGLHNVDGELGIYIVRKHKYLDAREDQMRGNAYKYAWGRPKVIANAARISRGPWRIVATVDEDGLICYQRFLALWAKTEMPLTVIAATLNGPVANALLSASGKTRDNLIRDVKAVPVPQLSVVDTKRISELVDELRHAIRSNAALEEIGSLAAAIDTTVLAGYDLPRWLASQLFDYMSGAEHPRTGSTPVDQLRARHAALVDKKFLHGLSAGETAELERNNRLLDAAEESYYAPIKDMLSTARASVSGTRPPE